MPSPINIGTRDVPLKFAKQLTKIVNHSWADGTLLSKVSPVTKELLRFWFEDLFCENRNVNFHKGQQQAILNVVYAHEIIKAKNVFDLYAQVDEEILADMDKIELSKEKYQHPKYALKMATGTGKTWVMHALLIWQYLNAKHEDSFSGDYFKNFLLVAPGLVVYERLLDAYLGKENEQGIRNFDESDLKKFESLFIPPAYTEELFAFIQNSVCRKEEISRKVTGEGLLAITNWHLLMGEEEEVTEAALENPSAVVNEIFPIRPGISAGHDLNMLDSHYVAGKELDFLKSLPNLIVINDEAHHIHENKSYGDIQEVEWQKSLNYISADKRNSFVQIDFSATPYDVSGSGQNRMKHYFPHVIVDFDLHTAIHAGLVKTIALDRRKEIASLPLDFKAERDGNRIIGLSEGQKTMLRAGLAKLRILEEHFVKLTQDKQGGSDKHPKMFVTCENMDVAPFVMDYLIKYEGLSEDEVMQIDSGRKEFLGQEEWEKVKQRLFNVDKYSKPKVLVSVLMLKEGFDVNNICVIVPLRSTQAPILLEQTIGRGLRLMWREPEYQELKEENLTRLLHKKQEPTNYLDILSIIEHPAFIEFYNELIEENDVAVIEKGPTTSGGVLGDIINVGLKENYKEYDFYIPVILRDSEEFLTPSSISLDQLSKFDLYDLNRLKAMVPKGGDVFFSQEMTVKTRFGDYEVRADIFNSKSYNEFIAKIVSTVSSIVVKIGPRKTREFPVMQVNQVEVARVIDDFIKHKLFGETFDPFIENNWRVLLLSQTGIVEHIIKEISKAIYELQNKVDVLEAVVIKRWFSEVSTLRMRENYCLDLTKIIYQKQSYPSNKGGFEKAFMEFCDADTSVDAFVKINEHYHEFAHIYYVRSDGLLAPYSPDFVVKARGRIYIVETKAQDQLSAENIKRKQIATVDWVARVNKLKSEDRMNAEWEYVLLGENTFIGLSEKGASFPEIAEYAKITKNKVEGTLF